MHIVIRPESKHDYNEIKHVTDRAFQRKEEGKLVETLRNSENYFTELSLVAETQGQVVGHILFYPIHIISGHQKQASLAMAPLSVLPSHQKKGIGKKLVEAGLKKAKSLDFPSVIVLGHADYYPRLGFKRASCWKLSAPFEVPDESFFAMELKENSLKTYGGMVEYPRQFYEVS